MSNTTNTIINDYIEALYVRAELAGDGRLEYAMGFLQGTLKYCDLESLQTDTKTLNKLIKETNLRLK